MNNGIRTSAPSRRRFLGAAASAAIAAPAILRSAPHLAQPSPDQAAWQDHEMEMFLHFAPNTWQDLEYDNLSTPLDHINPKQLDAAQWVDVAQSLGAKEIVFVAKHAGGFCWWQTQTTDYSVKDTPWRKGHGDVMRDLAAACRKRGLRLGVYLSPQDRHFGAGVGGKCIDPSKQPLYDRMYRQQLTEVLSRYGEIGEIWFDGSNVVDTGDILKRYAPHAAIFQSPYATIRWVGNEDGVAPYPAWNAVTAKAARSGVATSKDSTPDGDVWLPIECDARMRATWFWNTHNEPTIKTVEQLMTMYYRSVGHGATLILNNTPDTTGLIPAPDVKRNREFGAEIRRRFAKPLAQTRGAGTTIELALPAASAIDHVVTMEDIRSGERVRAYAIEGLTHGAWRPLVAGSAVGHKKIDPFLPVEVSRVRLRVTGSAAPPLIRSLAVYSTGTGMDANAAAVSQFVYSTVRDWNPQSFSAGDSEWNLDLSPYCREAAQYELSFVTTGGGIRIRSVALLEGGVASPQFVQRVAGSRRYLVNVTGVGEKLILRAVVAPGEGDPSYGQVVIRRVLP